MKLWKILSKFTMKENRKKTNLNLTPFCWLLKVVTDNSWTVSWKLAQISLNKNCNTALKTRLKTPFLLLSVHWNWHIAQVQRNSTPDWLKAVSVVDSSFWELQVPSSRIWHTAVADKTARLLPSSTTQAVFIVYFDSCVSQLLQHDF